MDLEKRIIAYRYTAYAAMGFSAMAVLCVCLTLPMVYNYVHQVRTSIDNEIDLCKVCAGFSLPCMIYRAPLPKSGARLAR